MRSTASSALHGPRGLHRFRDDVLVDAPALEHVEQHVLADRTGDEVRVERVDVGIRLRVVAEERLCDRVGRLARLGELRARPKERGELVAQLVAHGAEAQPQEVL